MELTGNILEFEYEDRESYRLLFGVKTVTWECLAGSVAGSSGTDSYDAIEITPNILFITWWKDEGEAVSIVANFQNDILHSCDLHEETKEFRKGSIKRFNKASMNLRIANHGN